MYFRIAAVAALSVSAAFAQPQTAVGAASPVQSSASETIAVAAQLHPDENDAAVVRARDNVDRIRKLTGIGALPLIRLKKAEEDLQDALDLTILKQSLYSKELLPEQTDQMIAVAERMVVRRQRALSEMHELVAAGVLSRAEAETSAADLDRARQELAWAQDRARLVVQIAESVRLEKAIASLESQAEAHPEWAGKVYSRYDGNGSFTPADLLVIKAAYQAKFFKPLPVSADGETAVHRALGFDHRGRVDVALNPDQPEGIWLMRFLESRHIPYFAFRSAVPHMATGAHIHMGPGSTRLLTSE